VYHLDNNHSISATTPTMMRWDEICCMYIYIILNTINVLIIHK
jgi:hypothetical protein